MLGSIAPADWAVVGALARVTQDSHHATCSAINALPGVCTFGVGETERVGLLIESDTLEAAIRVLEEQIASVPGVLSTWPVLGHE